MRFLLLVKSFMKSIWLRVSTLLCPRNNLVPDVYFLIMESSLKILFNRNKSKPRTPEIVGKLYIKIVFRVISESLVSSVTYFSILSPELLAYVFAFSVGIDSCRYEHFLAQSCKNLSMLIVVSSAIWKIISQDMYIWFLIQVSIILHGILWNDSSSMLSSMLKPICTSGISASRCLNYLLMPCKHTFEYYLFH